MSSLDAFSIPPLNRRQLLLGLLSIGIREADIEAKIAALPSDQIDEALIFWRYSAQFLRNDPLVATLATAFALPVEQVDALWIWASTI